MWNTHKRKRAGESSTSSKASGVFRRHHHKLARFDARLLWQFLKRLQVGISNLFCAVVLQFVFTVRISRLAFFEPVWEKVELLATDQLCGGRPDLNTPSDPSEQNVVWTGTVEYLFIKCSYWDLRGSLLWTAELELSVRTTRKKRKTDKLTRQKRQSALRIISSNKARLFSFSVQTKNLITIYTFVEDLKHMQANCHPLKGL